MGASESVRRVRESLGARFNRRFFVDQFRPASGPVVLGRLRWLGIVLAVCALIWLAGRLLVKQYATRDKRAAELVEFVPPGDDSNGLVVMTHGWTRHPDDMRDVAETIHETRGYERHAIYVYRYDGGRFSNADPNIVALDLAQRIGDLYQTHPAEEIILVGHSVGGLLMRRAYLAGLEALDQLEPGRELAGFAWPRSVRSILLLATPNRGSRAIFRSRLLWLADLLVRSWGVGEFIQRTYYGAPFVVNLRIDWIRRWGRLADPPRIVQFLGDDDVYVSKEDSSDVFAVGAREVELSGVTHLGILEREHIQPVLRNELELKPRFSPPPSADEAAQKVLIVHGIRDYGDRFDRIGEAIRARAPDESVMAESPRYRYFSALQFVNPASRRAKLLEFTDLYAETVARAPVGAPIHFVGHSFGTYLLGAALEEYESIEFENVYLAGSVLEEGYNWREKFMGKVARVRNDRAKLDWPVGLLCAAVADLGLARRVGTGGFHGFTHVSEADPFVDVAYFQGGHGKALESSNHGSIASFVLQSGEGQAYDHEDAMHTLEASGDVAETSSSAMQLLSRMAAGLALLILGAVGYTLIVGRHPLLAALQILVVLWLLHVI